MQLASGLAALGIMLDVAAGRIGRVARNLRRGQRESVRDRNMRAERYGNRIVRHGAIEINSDSSDSDLSVRHVRIVGNNIKGAAHHGIRLQGNVCDVSIEGNEIADVSAPGIAVNHREDKPAGCDGRL